MLKKGFGNFIMNNDKRIFSNGTHWETAFKTGNSDFGRSDDQYAFYNIIDRIYIGHIP